MFQDKAQSAENGESFSRAATPYWDIWEPPFGRTGKRSSVALRLLARTSHYLRDAPRLERLLLVRSTTSHLAELAVIMLKEH
jgi:hypothetical protein